MKIAELLHFCLTAKRSGEIRFSDSSDDASICIRDGEVIAAQYKDIQGEEAFFALLLLEDQDNEFIEKNIQTPQSISKSTHFLLMEAARLSDESTSNQQETETASATVTEEYCLKFITLDNTKFALAGNTTTIGRDETCDIAVPDVSVSSTHCQIIWNGKHHLLSDMNSSNGTFLNDEWIETSRALSPGDRIQVGLCHFCYDKVLADDKLEDPQSVIPFTFGSETQKIELPAKNEARADKFPSQANFKDYQPVDEKKKSIHIWPFGKKP